MEGYSLCFSSNPKIDEGGPHSLFGAEDKHVEDCSAFFKAEDKRWRGLLCSSLEDRSWTGVYHFPWPKTKDRRVFYFRSPRIEDLSNLKNRHRTGSAKRGAGQRQGEAAGRQGSAFGRQSRVGQIGTRAGQIGSTGEQNYNSTSRTTKTIILDVSSTD